MTISKAIGYGEITVPAGSTSPAILFDQGITEVKVKGYVPSGVASFYVQTTLCPVTRVHDGAAGWDTWTAGTVTVSTASVFSTPNAVRLVNAGTVPVYLQVRGD